GRRRAEALVHEVLSPAARPNPQVLRLTAVLRDLAAGLIEIGGLEALHLQRSIVAGVRQPQAQPRIVAVVAGKGGVGATTAAWATASILATLRDDTAALVSVRPEPGRSWPASVDGLEAVGRQGDADANPNDVFDLVDYLSNRHAFTL